MNSLYIHIPFCIRKCSYCAFAIVVAASDKRDRYLEALSREAQQYKGEAVDTVYVGGGTPSVLSCAQLDALAGIVQENFKVAPGAEWTMEINPDTFDLAKAKKLSSLGFNRASLGVQSLDEKSLRYLTRTHDARQARKAFDDLREAGFVNISVDLMFSLPHQTDDELLRDLKVVTALNSEHLSLYSLNIEEGSRFCVDGVALVSTEAQADQYAKVVAFLEGKGFGQYEVSNFARPGFESRHNKVYWQGGNYIGLGMAAHSHKDGHRFANARTLPRYLGGIFEKGTALAEEESLSDPQRLIETLLLGLRMNEGVDVGSLQERYGCVLDAEIRERLDEFVREGFLSSVKERFKTTLRGRLVLDELCRRLI